MNRHGGRAKGRGLGDLVRAWLHHGTGTGCGHETRSAHGHAQVSLKGTYGLCDGDEADAADREMTAAVPARSTARQRRERQRERARQILRRLSLSEETRRSSKGARSGRSCEGVAAPRDGHGVRTRGALGPQNSAGVGVSHSRPAGWRRGGRSRPEDDGGRAGGIGRTSEARETKRARQADIATTEPQ